MPKYKYGKLVRDKIVEHQIKSGANPTYHLLDDEQHKEELVLKIIEEAKEIIKSKPEEFASEIADVQQALDDLKEKYNITDKAVADAQKIKIDKNGAFKKGIFIDYVEVDENDKWSGYYKNNSDRYPEIK